MQWRESSGGAPETQPAEVFAFGLNATSPPLADFTTLMQRADEVNTVQRMLSDQRTSAVMLIGSPGAGKSTLAALLYHRLLLAQQAGMAAPRHLVWLGLSTYTTLPDMIAAILSSVQLREPGFFFLKPEQQVSTLLRALRRPNEHALIVLDQFEALLHPETSQGISGRGVLPLFLEMLQTDLGASRIILTGYHSLFDEEAMEESRLRSYLVSRISMPEGIALLQQRGMQGSPEDLSLVWQRCGGHVYALILFCALVHLSGMAPDYLLHTPDYRSLWRGEVMLQLVTLLYQHLSPMQYALMRALCLFSAPVPLEGVIMTISADSSKEVSSQVQPDAVVERELQRLVQLSLVQVLMNQAEPGFYLHPYVRQYVIEHYLEGSDGYARTVSALGVNTPANPLFENPEAHQVALAASHMQVAAYYYHVARDYYPRRDKRTNLLDVEPLVYTIRHLCLSWRWQDACDLLFGEGLHESMVQWGAWNTLVGLYTALLPPFGVLQRPDEGLVASHLGMLYGRMGEPQQSGAYFEQALTIQRELGDQLGEAKTLTNQGELYREWGNLERAREHFERAVELNSQQQDVHLQSILLHNQGLLYHELNEHEQALYYYREALQLSFQQSDQSTMGMVLTNLGTLLYEQGRQHEALALLLSGLRVRKTLRDTHVVMLERFLAALEQRMGATAYAQLYQTAMKMQQHVFTRFTTADVRQ